MLRWNPESTNLLAAKIAASLTLTLFAKISPKIVCFRQIFVKISLKIVCFQVICGVSLFVDQIDEYRTAGFASLCTEVNTLSRNNQSTLTVFDTIFRKLLLYAFALLRFWNMLYERKRSPWTPKMAVEEVRLREQLGPESTSRVAIPASSAPQRALAPAM